MDPMETAVRAAAGILAAEARAGDGCDVARASIAVGVLQDALIRGEPPADFQVGDARRKRFSASTPSSFVRLYATALLPLRRVGSARDLKERSLAPPPLPTPPKTQPPSTNPPPSASTGRGLKLPVPLPIRHRRPLPGQGLESENHRGQADRDIKAPMVAPRQGARAQAARARAVPDGRAAAVGRAAARLPRAGHRRARGGPRARRCGFEFAW